MMDIKYNYKNKNNPNLKCRVCNEQDESNKHEYFFIIIICLLQEAKCGALTQISESIWARLDLQVPPTALHCSHNILGHPISEKCGMACHAESSRVRA